jgi:hypothetical protein
MDSTNTNHKTRFVSTKISVEEETKKQSVGLVQPSDLRKRRVEAVGQHANAEEG